MNTQGSYHAAANEAATAGEQALDANVSASGETQATSTARTDERQRSKPLPEDALIILPVRNLVLFPGVILPITIGRAKSRAAAQEAARLQRPVGVLLQTNRNLQNAEGLLATMIAILAIGIVVDSVFFANVDRAIRRRWGLAEPGGL